VGVGSVGGMEMLWWRCCWGHVFTAPPVAAGEAMSCPVEDGEGPCGTFFLYMPFASAEMARRGELPPGPERWAPWARSH
jgi:hypothetical protein